MDKTYSPELIESQWYETWEKEGYFQAKQGGEPYCIMLPPPNVTGTLHMGHAFQHTLMDALIRYQRMRGRNTHWQAGTDHAGIATQMVVERQLSTKNTSRHDLGREKFIERVWAWKNESGNTISKQMRRLGDSPDWTQERFTMDEGLSKAVTQIFVSLYEEDLIYRGNRLVNWDPLLHTAISDLEVISEEESGHLWHIRYPLPESSQYLVVATTRPETMLGDTAVAVHPEDSRYQHLIGTQIQLPLSERTIPIISDEYVDPSFGTGCVKITPAHDFNDYEIGLRHKLPLINIFTSDAKINENAPEKYQTLDRYDARKRVIEDLEAADLLEKTEDHKLMVPRGDRSGAVIEPYLTNQWYVKAKPLAEPAIQAVETGKIRFVPENWSKTYFNWMHNIEDWCISRQLWWGHRIPAWYDENGNIYVAHCEKEARKKYQISPDVKLAQDEDVLDTWFSSALWPFSTLGWPEKTARLNTYYPSNVLVTGFDIIFFWVARMVMMGLKFMGDVPFREVYITGLIRDEQGQKMSKTKGNILDPLDLIDGISRDDLIDKRTKGLMQPQMAAKIEKATRQYYPEGIQAYGTDALRFTLASLATTGRDIKFDMNRMEGYRNFCNKLWNAARYVLMNTQDIGLDTNIKLSEMPLSLADRWILSTLQTLKSDVSGHLDEYRFDLAAQSIHEYIWNEYCDWYIELSKPVLNGDHNSADQVCAARMSLLTVLEALLRIAHPLIPFITEEIWQQIAPLLGKQGKSIMLESFPVHEANYMDQQAEKEIAWIKAFVIGIRRIRSEMDIKPAKRLPVLLQKGSTTDRQLTQLHSSSLKSLAKLDSIEWLEEDKNAPESAIAISGEMAILIPLAGLIDKEEELKRLAKEKDKLQTQHDRIKSKLGNQNFINNAPSEIVEKEQQKLNKTNSDLNNLNEQIQKISQIK